MLNYKTKAGLDLSSRISDMIMRDMLGLSTSSEVFSNAQSEPTTLDEEKLKEIIAKLHSDELEDQKRLIKLLASVGFNIYVMNGFNENRVFLPDRYAQAIAEVRQEQNDR